MRRSITRSRQVSCGNNATTDEGGAIAEEYRVEYAVDRVATVSSVWMGVSMECAQCHNHKYDPFSQEDYYSLFAYFNQAADPGMQTRNGNQSPIVDLYDQEKLQLAEDLKLKVERLKEEREKHVASQQEAMLTWVAEASKQSDGVNVMPAGQTFYASLDELEGRSVACAGSDKESGELKGPVLWSEGRNQNAFQCNAQNYIDFGQAADFERDQAFSYGCWIKPEGNPSGAVLAKMNDSNAHRGFDLFVTGGTVAVHIIHSWPGNAIKVNSTDKIVPDQWQHLFVTYDGSSKAAGIKIYINGKETAWTIEQDGLTESIRSKSPLHIGRRDQGAPYRGLVDDVRIFNRVLAASEIAVLGGEDLISPLLAKPETDRTDSDRKQLSDHYFATRDEAYRAMTDQLADLGRQIEAASKPYVNVMIMSDAGSMRPTFVLERGNYDAANKDKPVQPGVPAVLPALPSDAPANRLGLAQWIASGDHPLTARVAVNRYWALLFGEGIVRTLSDFGAQGEWPSHPELLDWLAADFVENNWNIKRTIKQIVMSATYRQSSRHDADKASVDPRNRLLWRGPRFRLQAEFIRDNALAVSGLLVPTIGGPGVKPYQPPGLWNEVSLSGDVKFVQDKGRDLYRRSMYTYWKRSAPAPAMTAFDCPTREKSVMQRSRTNTPLQALVTMNDTQFMEAARVLATRSLRATGGDVDKSIRHAYRLSTAVHPSDKVQRILKSAFDEEHEIFQAETPRAEALLKVGDSEVATDLNSVDLAAMTIVASMILNLDETLTLP
ncbi:MAG: DUF1553 domain-containing protein [Pirellulaceae bacterium]